MLQCAITLFIMLEMPSCGKSTEQFFQFPVSFLSTGRTVMEGGILWATTIEGRGTAPCGLQLVTGGNSTLSLISSKSTPHLTWFSRSIHP